jgi:hypothetical protein
MAEHPGPQGGFGDHVDQRHLPPAVADGLLQAPQVPRLGLRIQGRELDRAALAVGDPQPVQAGQRVVQGGELGAHLLPQPGGERGGVQRLVELLVVLGAVDLEVAGEILVGVAPLLRAEDPDLLAAQPLAQRLKDARLIDVADDPGAPTRVGLRQQVGPARIDGAIEDDVLAERVVLGAAVGVAEA